MSHTQVNSEAVCYLLPPLALGMPAEAMSEMQKLLHATSAGLVRCGELLKGLFCNSRLPEKPVAVKSVPGKSNVAAN